MAQNTNGTEMRISDEMNTGDRELLSSLGTQITVWAFSCDEDLIDDIDRIASVMKEYIWTTDMKILGRCMTKYKPQGVTAIMTLAESHILIQTWPEHGAMQIELFSCKKVDAEALKIIARDEFKAKRIHVFSLV